MADKQSARLAYQMIHSHFGPVVAKVASCLLLRGRLPFAQLVRLSAVPPKDVRLALLILIQHNIVWHCESETDGEVYEINWEEPIARLRFGRYLMIAKENVGEQASEIIETILDHGKLRMNQVVERLSHGDAKRSKSYKSTFHTLVESKYLRPSTPRSHISPRDRLIQYEAECKKERIAKIGSAVLMPKDLIEIKIMAGNRIQKEEEEADALAMVVKPKAQDTRPGRKKAAEDEMVVNEEIYFKVNYPKFNTCIRNQIIVQAAQHRYNIQTAEVLRAALKACEHKQINLLDLRSDPITSHLISPHISPNVDLSPGIRASSRSKKGSATVKDYISILCNEDNPTPSGAASAFMAPVSSGGGGHGRVTVEFDVIGRRLKMRVLESNVRERFGDDAVKIVRILVEKGKMDEKHLAKVALMAPNTLRPLLTHLSSASLVFLQEVPRLADRNPSRTIYLWYVDLAKAYSNLISALYQTLANIVTRDRDEQENVRPVLDKRDRSDVNGDERLLGRGEITMLREWEDKQERLNVLAMRVEENLFILRDMMGDPEPNR
ncbi:RNA polymerase III subunit C82 [Tulasnella sp. 403]|nr:RNA polymerase III subunit C82 [Tulasnella sp. 403]